LFGSIAWQSVADVLEATASEKPAPGSGAAAALALGLGAACAGKAARISLKHHPDRGGLATAATLEKIESSGREALAEMRRLLGVLRTDDTNASPDPVLTPTPGVADLEPLVASVRGAGVLVDLTVEVDAGLPPAVDVSVFRIVQEALTNVLKHAAASRVTVRLTRDAAGVTAVVEDDGTGFDAATPNGGLGLTGMRERVGIAGGRLTVDSALGKGTTLLAEVPLR